MKQKTTKLALMLLVAVVAFTSCSKSSKTAHFLPDDAITMRIDVKQILDKSKAADNDAVKQQLAKNLEAMGKNEEAKAVLKAVAEDPAKAGIDLRQPLWVSTNAEGKNALLVGELLDKDDFVKLLTALDKAPKEKDGIQYIGEGTNVIAFDDDCFVVSEGTIDDVIKKFNTDTKGTMAESDDFSKLADAKGIMQVLIPMGVAQNQLTAEQKALLPNGLDMKDLSILLDLSSEKGSVTLSVEAIAKSDAWKQNIEEGKKLMRNIDGDYANYIAADGMSIFCNIDGKAYFDYLEKMGVFKNQKTIKSDQLEMAKGVLGTIDGDFTAGISKWEGFIPNVCLYLKTKDKKIIEALNQLGIKSSKEMNFGEKNGTTYLAIGGEPFAEAKPAVSKSNLKGHRVYIHIGAQLAAKAIQGFCTRSQAKAAQSAVESIKSIEIYDTADTKVDFRVNMNDADKDPVEILADIMLGQFGLN
ncbi:DUF4836 family protein [Prevotella brevis]|nr:DUF4836 family protein [Xylanibacter brevis]